MSTGKAIDPMFNSPQTRESLYRLRVALLRHARRCQAIASQCDTNSILMEITEERMRVQLEELATIEFTMMDILVAISDLEKLTGLKVHPSPPEPEGLSREREARVRAAIAAETPEPAPKATPIAPKRVRKTTKPSKPRAVSAA